MSPRPFTLHIRMTKHCNADCSYCSSFEQVDTGRMSPESFEKAVQFIFGTAMKRLGVSPTHMTAQYLGGEILTYPIADLTRCVSYLRDTAAHHGMGFMDGCQSNLIGSVAKVDGLYRLFNGRVGTSVDSRGQSRTVQGSAEKYRLIWQESDSFLRNNRSTPGAVFVLDKDGLENAEHEVKRALLQGRAITLRPVFQGGTPGQQLLGAEDARAVFMAAFEKWFMASPIIIEPFFSMAQHRLEELSGNASSIGTACAFQSDCTKKSLSLEPNGDLYLCQEMADAGLFRIGNAVTGEWDLDTVEALGSRSSNLHEDCRQCPYLATCQGGCMFEAVQQGRGLSGKSYHCLSWKSLFASIDDGIKTFGAGAVREWLHRLDVRNRNALNDGLAKLNQVSLEECADA